MTAVVDQQSWSSSFSPLTYNRLPSVEKANEQLQLLPLKSFLSVVKGLAEKYGVDDILGLRLIHKHFDIKDNLYMVEHSELWEGKQALVTRPTPLDEAIMFPASWILNEQGEYEAFEFSSDPVVTVHLVKLRSLPYLLEEYKQLAFSYGVSHLLAPSILRRTWEKEFLSAGNTSANLIEFTFNNASVVRNEKDIQSKEFSSVVTAWYLTQPHNVVCVMTRYCGDFGGRHNENSYYHAVHISMDIRITQ